jgi:hypothetical protein
MGTKIIPMQFPPREKVEEIKQKYQKGMKLRLIWMEDELYPVRYGTIGKVVGVDDMGHILMNWDCGSSLSLIPDIDEFDVVE